MKIGVVIIAYNYGQFLDEAVASVFAQTRAADELVVVDDGSTNRTREQVATLPKRFTSKQPTLRVILAEHGGQPHARNTGVRALNTDVVLCLDGDDRLKPDALLKLAAACESDPGAALAYGWVEKFGNETGVTEYEPWDPVQLLDHNFVQPSACLFKRSAWEHSGGWSMALQKNAGGFDDWAFMIALAEAGERGVQVREPVVDYRRHQGADLGRMRRTTSAARAMLAQRHLWHYLSTYGPRVAALGPASISDLQTAIRTEAAVCDELRTQLARAQSAQQYVREARDHERRRTASRLRKLVRPLRHIIKPAREAARRALHAATAADLGPVPIKTGPTPHPKLPVLHAPREWPTVDIVTVLFNSAAHIEALAESLRALDYPREKLHIFFVDNASTDGSGERLQQLCRDVPHSFVRLGQNVGFTGGNNVAMRASRADYIFLLNPDAVAAPNVLKLLVMRALQERGIGMVEAAQQPIDHPKDYDPETQETSWCTGAAVLISRAALQRTGVFDERFFMYCEDIDLSWRMWTHGFRCIYEPRARVQHEQGVASHKGGERGYYFSLRNGLMMRLVYGGPRSYVRYAAALAALSLAPGQKLRNRRYPVRAIVTHLRHLPHLWARRRDQADRPLVPNVQFYGWDYHVRRW